MKHRPQLLRLITRLNIGGPARQALLLTRELSSDYRTCLAAGTPGPHEGELQDPSVPVRHLPFVRPLRPRVDVRALVATRRLLTATGAELVHTHMAKAGAIGRLAALTVSPRPRTVHTFHGHVLDGYFSRPAQRAFVAAERTLARTTDVLIAVSTEIRDALLDLGIGTERRFVVVPLGLDLDPFLDVAAARGDLRARLALDPNVPLVGIVGRLAPIKDHPTLFEAIVRLPGVHLAVLGDGELRSELTARARSLGIADRVHLIGWWSDVAGALSDLDVVALSSRNEGTPVSLIEALATGRPVVATDVGGVRSTVDHGISGLLCRPRDPQALADAVRKLLVDRSLAAQMGRRGRELVQKRFGKDRLVMDIRALYSELLPRTSKAREPSMVGS